MDTAGSSVWKRFERSGLALQELHKKSNALWSAHQKYFDYCEIWNNRFQALNNSIAEVRKHPGINPIEYERRNAIIFRIGDIGAKHLPDHENLIIVHPAWFQEITDAGKFFEKTARFLQKNYSKPELCEARLKKAEETLQKVTSLHSEMEKRLNELILALNEQKDLYHQVVD